MRTGKKLILENLWKYLLVAVASIFIWSAVFEALDQVKDNQRVTVATYNLNCNTQALKDELLLMLPGLTQQEIMELYVDDLEHTPNQTYATDILTAQILQSDLIVMPKSLLDKLNMLLFFPELPENLRDENCYEVNGVSYGILISHESRFAAHCVSEEPYYLLLSSQSVNLGGLLGRGEAKDNAALKIMEYLLEEDRQ